MKKILLISLGLVFTALSIAQDAAREWTVQVSATVSEAPAEITLNWLTNTNATPNTYLIWRKEKGATSWGASPVSLPSTTLTYTDNTVEVGVSYEYRIELRLASTIYAWGYINAGINVELDPNKGDMLLVVDSTHFTTLSSEIQQLEDDLYRDGWMVTTIGVDPTATAAYVKSKILSTEASLSNLQGLYLLGNVPVPYSGNLYPDAHPDHEGAWPADVYYGDLDGTWTDATVNNTVATSPRNDNVPGDGKFDQSKVPSEIELQIGRVDMNDLPAFTLTESELLQAYLNKAHDFKEALYQPMERGLVDQGGFTAYAEGFAQNGFRNFTAFFGDANVDHVDYWTNLDTTSYLWSYGCGAGSYTSAGGLNGGAALTTAQMAAGNPQTVFTMLFGSYFGDWDVSNNFLRSSIASGKTLSCSWAGRPNFHYHHMALGENIGYSARLSQTKFSGYHSLDLGGGFVTTEGVHVAQMGDPSLRMYYIIPPTDLTVTNVDNVAELSWTASTDGSVEGYNVYRRTNSTLWEKVNTSLVATTTYSDATVPTGEEYIYLVKAVKTKTNGSGIFYNESLGTYDSDFFSVGLDEDVLVDARVYPNPTNGKMNIVCDQKINEIKVTDVNGRLVLSGNANDLSNQIDMSNVPNGVYFVKLILDANSVTKRVVIQH